MGLFLVDGKGFRAAAGASMWGERNVASGVLGECVPVTGVPGPESGVCQELPFVKPGPPALCRPFTGEDGLVGPGAGDRDCERECP